jgi:glycosyltransferase involved in cell wall biosynthesis
MKILLLVMKDQRVILDRLYESIAEACQCDIRWLTDDQQSNLKNYFLQNVDIMLYDRIVLFLRVKKILKQAAFLKTIPRLVYLEHDACQNYMSVSKYKTKFSAHYRMMPWARIIVSGNQLSEHLRREGFDAVFVPKGYDQELLWNHGSTRDIELAFVGSLKNQVYADRVSFLDALKKVEPIEILKTDSGEEYRILLNRIKYFICPDVGMGEYMIKTFEALACGCVVFAFDQGEAENDALKFKHMENIILFKSLPEFRTHLAVVRNSEGLARSIASHGQQLAEAHYQFSEIGKLVVSALSAPLRNRNERSIRSFLFGKFFGGS